MQKLGILFAGVVALQAATPVSAGQVGSERYELDGMEVTVVLHPFLTEEETTTLRVVGQNQEALALFVPEGSGFAALAIAPAEGFVRDGIPVESATAISGLPDIDEARRVALEACDTARVTDSECVIALELAPR